MQKLTLSQKIHQAAFTKNAGREMAGGSSALLMGFSGSQRIESSKPNAKITPILFDVSLRDGIQGADPATFTTYVKLKWLKDIHEKYNPPKMEVGSFVSPKVLPIMADTPAIFNYAASSIPTESYVLVPNKTGLLSAIDCGARNFSFITSVSNAFQVKNTRRNLEHKKAELREMLQEISRVESPCKTKLYVSCINQCPLFGLIDNDVVLNELLSSYVFVDSLDEICLSDTMGTLKCADFEYIVDGLLRFGLAKNRISVHLHIGSDNHSEAKRILFACFKRGIQRFDVSAIMDGGCSVSMNASQLKPNMTYEFFYSALEEHLNDVRR
jgi:hydroxymethylglutaryl-CoA lyase